MNDTKYNKEAAETAAESSVETSPKEEKSCKKKKKISKEEELKEQVRLLTDNLAKEKEDYVRLMAEFETFRRRNAEEKLNLVSTAAADTVKGMLPVLDDCERAIAMLESSSDEAAKEGTKLIYENLMKYLKTLGLEKIEAKGQPFDTDFHEAVAQFPGGEELKDKVFDVVQNGYLFKGKILRYAKVVVGI